MRIVFDKEGYVSQFIMNNEGGFIPNENEQIIQTPDDLDVSDFIRKHRHYHLVDGKLVKDENRQAQLEKAELQKKKVLTTQEKIALFIEAIPVDEPPADYKEGKYKPYFDKNNMKFTWRKS